jgi:hypothetical protein
MSQVNRSTAHRGIATALAAATMVLLGLLPALSSAAPPVLSEFCERGVGAGQCNNAVGGVATNPVSGNVYLDDGNNRVSELSPWGAFIRAWGGGVVSGGAEGTGDVTAGSTVVTSIDTTEKSFLIGQIVTGAGIPPGTRITDTGIGRLTLSRPATVSGSGVTLTVTEGSNNVPTNERQLVSIGEAPSGGSFTLTFATGHTQGQVIGSQMTNTSNTSGALQIGDDPGSVFPPGTTITAFDTTTGAVTLSQSTNYIGNGGINGTETTAPIPYNAAATQVQSALEALPAVGAGNAAVSGSAGGPYTVEFKGPFLADTNVARLEASATGLTPSGSVTVSTLAEGAGAAESCVGAECGQGIKGSAPGQFADSLGVAVDSQGSVYVADRANRRVQKFDSEGNFLLMFGGGVDQGPNHPGNLCTAAYIAEGDVCGKGSQGSGDGQFGAWSGLGNFIAAGPGDKIYVGDEGRIQRFDTAGTYVESIPLPGETVQSLAVDPSSGNIYVSFKASAEFSRSKNNLHKLSPAGQELAEIPFKTPSGLAPGLNGDLYVFDEGFFSGSHLPEDHGKRIVRLDSSGKPVEIFAENEYEIAYGLATSSACGIPGVDLYIVGKLSGSENFARIYGSPPNPAICPPPAVAPTISDQYAIAARSDGATLKAEINPHFWPDPVYFVEYGTGKCSEGGCDQQQPLAPGSKLTNETINKGLSTAGVFIHGLAPNTTYHYRFVAKSSGGGPVRGVGGEVGEDGAEGTFTTLPLTPEANVNCPNQAFRISTSARLPDCRAYEMVSPVDKDNGDIEAVETGPGGNTGGRNDRERIVQASPDGDRMTYASQRAFADSPSASFSSQYLASRDPQDGWLTRSVSPPRGAASLNSDYQITGPFRAFSEDLCSAWVIDDSVSPVVAGAPSGVANLYRRDNCGGGGYEVLTSVAPPGYSFETEPDGVQYFPYPQGIVDGGARTIFNANAKLTDRACATKGATQLYETTEGGSLRLVSALPNGNGTCNGASVGSKGADNSLYHYRTDTVANAVSRDGSRVFWTDSGSGLYLRINPEQPQSAISAGKCTQPARACTVLVSDGVFLDADPSGSRVIYQSGQNDEKLYEAQIEEEGGELVSHSTLIAENVLGLLGASEDTTRIYLASSQALTAGANKGLPNLYLYEKGVGFRFIVTLANRDQEGRSYSSFLTPLNRTPFNHAARVSPDGLHAAFMSWGSLTGYDNRALANGSPAAEVYVYDASAAGGAGALNCASCNPSGARPHARDRGFLVPTMVSGAIPGWETEFQPSRVLSDDGKRLFFESFEALVGADTNGQNDIYEWEAAGSGSCTAQSGSFSKSAGGCVDLITSGESPEDVEFLDASADGRDVFFSTSASLLPQDPGLVDIYDARAGGGLPPPPAPAAACEGEACQGAPAPPNDPTPASSSFEGAGNVVEKPTKKKHKAKKKRHAKKKHKAKKQANHKRRASR